MIRRLMLFPFPSVDADVLESKSIETRAGSSLSPNEQASAQTGSDSSRDPSSDSLLRTELVASPATQTSSVESVVTGIKRHKLAAFLSIIIVVAAAIGAFALYRTAGHTEAAIESIAVLPFENQNHDPNTDYRRTESRRASSLKTETDIRQFAL